MAMKKTLLEIVQDILTIMESEPVNTLSDSIEAEDVASVVESTYYDTLVFHEVPDHKGLIKLVPLSDNEWPTHFIYPSNVNRLEKVWYDTSDDQTKEYSEVTWCDPLDFLRQADKRSSGYQNVIDKTDGTNLRIGNENQPTRYTSFDNDYIVMDSFLKTEDDSLQQSKVRAWGNKYPDFNRFSDVYYPDLPDILYPYFIAESKSRSLDIFKGGTTQKTEQAARRGSAFARNKMKTEQPNPRNNYGR
jgi:hypothetical protein